MMRRREHARNLLPALARVAAVVARADGSVAPAERLGLGRYLRDAVIPDLQPGTARALFDTCIRELEREPAAAPQRLAASLSGFRDTPWAWIILRAAERVAGADGALHPSEARAIETIRAALDLPLGVPERYPACVMHRARA